MKHDVKKLRDVQKEIARSIILRDDFGKIKKVAGFDIAYACGKVICSAVVVDFDTLDVIEKKHAITNEEFPYIPTLLSFREMPAMLKAYKMLENEPDMILVDGQGILHPFRAGIASHFGIAVNKPAIGVAKSRLIGDVKGGKIYVDGKLSGVLLFTKRGCNPLYVSPGHRVSVNSCARIVKKLVKSHKLPEPTRIAHKLAGEIKAEIMNFEASIHLRQVSD